MDSIRQIARILNSINDQAKYASRKFFYRKPIERALDTFDHIISYEMDFRTKSKNFAHLSLQFKPPAPSICCGTCYCSVCEQFSGNLTITLTYGYISGTLNVFVGATEDSAVRITDVTEIDPDAGTLSIGTTGEFVRVCYVYFAGGCNPLDTGGGGGGSCSFTEIDDQFTRTGAWNDIAFPWVESTGGTGTSSTVSGGRGILSSDHFFIEEQIPVNGAFIMTAKMKFDSIPDFNVGQFSRMDFFGKLGSTYKFLLELAISNAAGSGDGYGAVYLQDQHGGGSSVDLNWAFIVDTDYMVKLQSDGIGTIQCKVWLASDPEPGSWLLTTSSVDTTIDTLGPSWSGDVFTAGTQSVYFEFITITCE